MRRLIGVSSALILCSACGCTSTVQSEPSPEVSAPSPEVSAPPPSSSPTAHQQPPAQDDQQQPPAQDDHQLQWTLEVVPPQMRMDQRSECRIRVSVTNNGAEAAVPVVSQGQFTIDGQPSRGLNMSFGNGAMEPRWMSLPPGETVSTERGGCEHYFEAAGEYTIGYRQGAADLTAPIRIIQ